jgi:hypothetical protein
MRNFKAVFVNKDGLRLVRFVQNLNWYKLEEKAKKELDEVEEHKKYGPWTLVCLDVSA